ncbi:retron St85 family RNA-directed DNA polymerase [Xanthomonas arboricola]|uniref:retron St85 family RNA-directed DNA polymerase n=1 Tax=Xanthomonas arboricola TaxID=56448 RepID=UPI00118CA6DB|nr:retron St85 family RNA-directed DNA polymerase [Xanthomonas arboricola]QDS14697.1 RNA-directed DNA polymerase [Xanthomonas arboricola]
MTTNLVHLLSREVGLPISDIEKIIASAPRRYKEFKILKKNGRGVRDIAQPSRELKALQRAVVSKIAPRLPVHDCVHGYVLGRGIKSNAQSHLGGSFILKMDLSDFFPSIKPVDLRHHLNKFLPEEFDDVELRQLELILFWIKKGTSILRMCIGAPSSPLISNTIMFDVDLEIDNLCRQYDVKYTRYADDLTFSCSEKGVLSLIQRGVSLIVRSSKSPIIKINEEKTLHLSKRAKINVTGVNLTPDGSLSIGRERKRLIRVMAHHHSLGSLDAEGQNKLIGLLGFAFDIEPNFAMGVWGALAGAPKLLRTERR